MPHLTTTPGGTPVDLDTARGQYEYLGEFLASHGAPSTTLSLLEKLYAAAKPQPGQIAVSREDLLLAKSALRGAAAVLTKRAPESKLPQAYLDLADRIETQLTSPAADQRPDQDKPCPKCGTPNLCCLGCGWTYGEDDQPGATGLRDRQQELPNDVKQIINDNREDLYQQGSDPAREGGEE